MIDVQHLSKRYGPKTAVNDLSFTVRPGIVTGFLGPNGAGKSTTMRMVMGLDRPTTGSVTVNGRPLAEHAAPMREIGALLEAKAIHPGRSARDHLLALAATTGVPQRRVNEVLDLVGLHEVAGKRAGAFSLGMGQRLGIASALLGDPKTIMLDEPANGLDPDGILWIRTLLKRLAAEGRTVFVSSHLMSEMALTAEHLIVIAQGQLVADLPVAEFIRSASTSTVVVRTPQFNILIPLLAGPEVTITSNERDVLEIIGLDARTIGERAFDAGIVLHELATRHPSLEEAFMALTKDLTEYTAIGDATETRAA